MAHVIPIIKCEIETSDKPIRMENYHHHHHNQEKIIRDIINVHHPSVQPPPPSTQCQLNQVNQPNQPNPPNHPATVTKLGSRRIFTPQFKLQVLDSYRSDSDCKGNQRATARKYGIHRRQIQKWLQCESNLRSSVSNSNINNNTTMNSKISNCNNQNVIFKQEPHHKYPNTVVIPPSVQVPSVAAPPAQQPQQPKLPHSFDGSQGPNGRCVTFSNNKSNTGFVSPIRSHSTCHSYTPVPYENNNNVNITTAPAPTLASASLSTNSSPVPVYTTHNVITGGEQSAYMPHPQYELREYSPNSNGSHYIHYIQSPLGVHRNYDEPSPMNPYNHDHIPYEETYYYDLPPMMAVPIDLSLHNRRSRPHNGSMVSRSPSPTNRLLPLPPPPPHLSSSSLLPNQLPNDDYVRLTELTNVRLSTIEPAAWDLSCRKRKIKNEIDTSNQSTSTPPKVIKLFKPYLLSDDEDEDDAKKFHNHQQHNPIIWSNYTNSLSCSPTTNASSCYDFNNNTSLSCYSSAAISPVSSYEQAPTPTPIIVPTPYHQFCGYGSPVSGYDTASSYSSSSEYGADELLPNTATMTSSYSIDFKIQAIDSYYNDDVCRGNEMAVADKYSVRRRDIQKWLMQEDDLRHQLVTTG